MSLATDHLICLLQSFKMFNVIGVFKFQGNEPGKLGLPDLDYLWICSVTKMKSRYRSHFLFLWISVSENISLVLILSF